MTFQPVKLSADKTLMLRGLAILGVLGIHLLAYAKNIYTSPEALLYVSLDQLGRFCVPLFVILSGYGLAQRYGREAIPLAKFYQRRVLKLLPPYILWSVVSYLLFMWIPDWRSYKPLGSFWKELLLGQVDYQLYFMVLIFQLYALFPLLIAGVKKWPNLVLGAALLLQAALLLWYAGELGSLPRWFLIDSNQYVVFVSWIGYFVLGIWLSLRPIPGWLVKAMPWLAGLGLAVAAISATHYIQTGTDPLIALRTTRLTIMGFAAALVITMMTFKRSVTAASVPSRLNRILSWLGKESYVIFLAHTILLRLIFDTLEQSRDLVTLGIALVIWASTVWVTYRYLIKD